MDVGAELRRARHARGLSLEQLSNSTKISVEDLVAIEDNRIDQLSPTVNVRNSVRAYATEVRLDPDDVTERYSSQGDATPVMYELDDSPGSIDEFPSESTETSVAVLSSPVVEPPATPDSVPTIEPLAAPPIEEAFHLHHASEIQAIDPRGRTDFGLLTPGDTTRIFALDEPSPAEPLRHRSGHGRLFGAVAVLIFAIAGALLLFDWRPAFSPWRVISGPANAPQHGSDQEQNPASEARARSEGDRVPVLPREQATATTGEKVETPVASPEPEHATDSTPAPGRSPIRTKTGTDSGQNLTGSWTVTNRVESTAYEPFENLNLGYRLKLTQTGNHVRGTGRKWMENGRQLPRSQQTAIEVEGTVEGQRVVLGFTEHGTRRMSAGTFTYDISESGILQGSFASDVAESKGSSRATRIRPRE